MKLPRRQFLHLAASAAALPAVSRVARAQAYPTRPVRILVPFPAAGPSDILARLYGQKLSQRWHQPVVVENRVGATGTIGTEAVVRAPPDGYTLLFTADLPITMAPALLKLRYDPQRDLVPVAALAKNDALLVVHPSTGIRSLADQSQQQRPNRARSLSLQGAMHHPLTFAAKCSSDRPISK